MSPPTFSASARLVWTTRSPPPDAPLLDTSFDGRLTSIIADGEVPINCIKVVKLLSRVWSAFDLKRLLTMITLVASAGGMKPSIILAKSSIVL